MGGHLPDQFDNGTAKFIDGDPDWMLPIMSEIANSFEEGILLDHQLLSDRIGLSSRCVHELTSHLVDAQLLRQVSRNDPHQGLTLARPADKILLVEILDVAQQTQPKHEQPAWRTFTSLKQVERQAAEGKSLADVTPLAARKETKPPSSRITVIYR